MPLRNLAKTDTQPRVRATLGFFLISFPPGAVPDLCRHDLVRLYVGAYPDKKGGAPKAIGPECPGHELGGKNKGVSAYPRKLAERGEGETLRRGLPSPPRACARALVRTHE